MILIMIHEHTQHTTQSEMLQKWLKEGLSPQAVAVYGTSVEELAECLKSGHMLPYRNPNSLPYYEKLLEHGRHCYFAISLPENLIKFDQQIVTDIQKQYPDTYNPQFLQEEFSTDKLLTTASQYAWRNAIRDHFTERTGVFLSSEDILLLTGIIMPEKYDEFCSDKDAKNGILSSFGFDDPQEALKRVQQARFQIGLNNHNLVKSAINESLSRRGVLIFYDSSILNHHIIVGQESEDEIIIITQEHLPLDTISGVQPLSKRERALLLKVFN